MKAIQEQWEIYKKIAIPVEAPGVQIREMRRAYYAGVESLLRILWVIGAEDVSEDEATGMIQKVDEECREFAAMIARSEA